MRLAATALLALALGAAPLGTPDHVGFAVRYDPGVMEERAQAHDAPPADCYVAYTLARDKDMARLWLRVQGPAGTLDCLVVDLPDDSKGDRERLIARQVWVELGYKNRWICGRGWSGRARDCKVKVWVLPASLKGVLDGRTNQHSTSRRPGFRHFRQYGHASCYRRYARERWIASIAL